jgi:hypothetical protein
MKKNKITIIAISIIFVLGGIFGVALWYFLDDNEEQRELFRNEQIRIVVDGEIFGDFTFDELLEKGVQMGQFSAIFKPNQRQPIERQYEGIEVRDIFSALGIDLEAKSSIVFRASDGFRSSAYTISEVLTPNTVFIAVKYDGEEFIRGITAGFSPYPNEDGGPFVVIRRGDSTSQFRIRILTEISVA